MTILPIEKSYIKMTTNVITCHFPWQHELAEQWIEDVKKRGDEMNHKTNVKADMTKFEALVYDDLYIPLKEFMISLCKYHDNYSDQRQLTITDMWGAVYRKGESADMHEHHPAAFSFVYYLKASQQSSPLIFPTCEAGFNVRPAPGLIALFPGYLHHAVPPQQIEEERIVIAGNMNMINKEGIFE